MAVSRSELRRYRCGNGAKATLLRVASLTTEELIIASYVHTENEMARKMMMMYEQMVLKAKLYPKEYEVSRDKYQTEIAKYIIDNNIYREWADFIYILTLNFSGNEEMMALYASEAMETWAYIGYFHDDKVVYGVTTENKLLLATNQYGDWDIPLVEANKKIEKQKINPQQALVKILIPIYEKIAITEGNENLATIATFGLLPFINERTKEIYPKKFFPMAEAKYIKDIRKWKDTSFYKELLKKRKYKLDSKGVEVAFKNAGLWQKILFIEEVTRDNKIVMLFKLSLYNNLGSTMGFYNITDDYFFTAYRSSDDPNVQIDLENFVLEVYSDLVVGYEKNVKRLFALKEVEDITNIPDYNETNIFAQYSIYNEKLDNNSGRNKKGGYSQKPHERRFALRKLSNGQTASEEALERAKELGYELPQGYTFVRGYKVGGIKEVRKELKV